jgi:thioredoxin reductase (NADPH)
LRPQTSSGTPLSKTEFDIVVVGSGIAGLSAALTASRRGRSTLLLTGDTLGGHLLTIDKVDGYPGFPEGIPGYDLCPIAQEQATEAGADIQMAAVSSLTRNGDCWQVDAPNQSYAGRSVIIATGTRLKELGIDNESALRGKGVSHCASCVAGGGDSALQEALTLAEHCASVTIVHHGPQPIAQDAYRKPVEGNPGITLLADSEITEILGQDAVDGIILRNLSSDETMRLECAGVFVFVGLTPNSDLIGDDALLDANRGIITDSAMRTSAPGLLAAGTVRASATGRAAAAGGDGAAAALAADAYLSSGDWG